MRRSGYADLPLHYGSVPQWLLERMQKMSLAITEIILADYGTNEFLKRLSDPFWFQSFGAVMGMDWHSSGITTSVMGVMKKTINDHSKDFGLFVCGGKGKHSRQTPAELLKVAEQTGINGNAMVRSSRLTAKVDNNAVQDGYQLYTHNFIVSGSGEWTVIQQGMEKQGTNARRYHWHSEGLNSFVEHPHSGVCGINQGIILNLTDSGAAPARQAMLGIAKEDPSVILTEIKKLVLPAHHDVQKSDINLKALGAVLWVARDRPPENFEELLLLEGAGPRTIQSLALVSEVIHGTAARFMDPARFSFAHGGKDGHPFPVPLNTYDEAIKILDNAIQKAKLGQTEKKDALKKLHAICLDAEKNFIPDDQAFHKIVKVERENSWKYGGRTVFGSAQAPAKVPAQTFAKPAAQFSGNVPGKLPGKGPVKPAAKTFMKKNSIQLNLFQ